MKKRILFINEASWLATGYADYGKEVIGRVHQSGKYEVAELSIYADPGDERQHLVPWRMYFNIPNKNDSKAQNDYNNDPVNQWGALRFEDVVLDFKPHIVVDWRDYWMMEFEERSPLRHLYNLAWLAPVDSKPQNPQWIASFQNIDGIFTYTDWAKEVLAQEGGSSINHCGVVPACANKDFYPVDDKGLHKDNMGLRPDSIIIGTVMRNQKRKLFPDLFEAFRGLLDKCIANKDYNLHDRLFLYCHTGHPDVGWHIPELLQRFGLGHKVLFTYYCNQCNHMFPAFFRDCITVCPKCNKYSATTPHVRNGVNTQQLGQIYNLFDAYVQYAICMPAGQEILTDKGWKPIEKVTTEDKALTHMGRYKPVLNTFTNKTDELYKVKVWGDYEEVLITGNHPWLAYTKDCFDNVHRTIRETLGRKKHWPEPKWVNTENLSLRDMVVMPIDDSIEDVASVDLAYYTQYTDVVYRDHIKIKGFDHRYFRFINIDEDFCQFAGLFVADGSWGKTQGDIKITCHNNEHEVIEFAETQISKLLNKPNAERKYKERQGIDVLGYSRLHRDFFQKYFGKQLTKQFPEFCLKLPRNKQIKLLQGYCQGDGHYLNDTNTTLVSTISPILANQLKTILRRLRIPYSVSIVQKTGKRKPQYKFEIKGNLKEGETYNSKNNTKSMYTDNGQQLLQVKSIEKIDCDELVYNIEVQDDNSYVSKGGVVHNCEGLGIPQIEAAACGVPVFSVDYSGMEDVVRKVHGYPIKVKRMFYEAETRAYRAQPDDDHCRDLLYDFLKQSALIRQKKEKETRFYYERYYNWDVTAKIWMDYFDRVNHLEYEERWKTPPRIHQWNGQLPPNIQNMTHKQFAEWAIRYVLGEPFRLGSYFADRLISDLQHGARIKGHGGAYINEASLLGLKIQHEPFNRELAVKTLQQIADNRNYWERVRIGQIGRKENIHVKPER